MIHLTYTDLGLSSGLILLLAVLSLKMRLGIGKQLIVATLRCMVQLGLIGFLLKAIFDHAHIGWVSGMAFFMLIVASREVMARQTRSFSGIWNLLMGTSAMFLSSFLITIIALTALLRVDPWYTPQYAIPLLGMLLGNTMNGISIGIDRLTQNAWEQQDTIEGKLMLGYTAREALADIRINSMRSALIPIINTMSISGLVSLPGMMTGQILAGSPPMEAVKYQILIMILIAGGVGLGTACAVGIAEKRLFDNRHRLRLDRLK